MPAVPCDRGLGVWVVGAARRFSGHRSSQEGFIVDWRWEVARRRERHLGCEWPPTGRWAGPEDGVPAEEEDQWRMDQKLDEAGAGRRVVDGSRVRPTRSIRLQYQCVWGIAHGHIDMESNQSLAPNYGPMIQKVIQVQSRRRN
jgi:hypothetical protein